MPVVTCFQEGEVASPRKRGKSEEEKPRKEGSWTVPLIGLGVLAAVSFIVFKLR